MPAPVEPALDAQASLACRWVASTWWSGQLRITAQGEAFATVSGGREAQVTIPEGEAAPAYVLDTAVVVGWVPESALGESLERFDADDFALSSCALERADRSIRDERSGARLEQCREAFCAWNAPLAVQLTGIMRGVGRRRGDRPCDFAPHDESPTLPFLGVELANTCALLGYLNADPPEV